MSARVDVIVIEGSGPPRIHHQRWGGGAVLAMLLSGPENATRQARVFDVTDMIDDIVAGCVIDHARSVLVIAGSVAALTQGGVRPAEHALLDDLAVAWPGWHLVYEPDDIVGPLVRYVRKLGFTLRALNEPSELDPEPKYALDAPMRAPRVLPRPADPEKSFDSLDLSIRAIHELDHAGLAKIGDVAGKSEADLAALGLTARVRREIFEALTST